MATTFSLFVAVLRGCAAAFACFGASTFATSSMPLRGVVVGVATSAAFALLAEAWRGVAAAFAFFAESAM
jgi:hypothetical protein